MIPTLTPETPTPEVNWLELLEHLSQPFPAEVVSWRAGAVSRDKKRAQALPYAEPRAYEDRLNSVCPGDWSLLFKPWGESKLICELTLFGVTRSSTGEYEENAKNTVAQGTAAEAQAFKRACSKFGLGRYLYDIPLPWVDYDDEKKRLVETPELPARFLPNGLGVSSPTNGLGVSSPTKNSAPSKVAPSQPRRAEETASVEDAPSLLSVERAEAMARELEKLDFSRREQLKLATSALGRPISKLESLSEAEALEVWASAKRIGKRAA